MGRLPQISRDQILARALEIVDADGLSALTTRRLADALDVKGPSLYNHFRDKDEILTALAEHALGNALRRRDRREASPNEGSKAQIVESAVRVRDAMLEHPELISVLVRQHSLGMGARMLDRGIEWLVSKGMPLERTMDLYESIDRFIIGSVLRKVSRGRTSDTWADDERYPHLAAAVASHHPDDDELFVRGISGLVDSVCGPYLHET